jgi:corrinoid protein of di/trimethylamine methyltransferase
MILVIVWIRVILSAVFFYLVLLNFIAQVIIGLFNNIEAIGGVTLREILQEIALAVLEGKKDAALEGVRSGLDAGINPLQLITEGLTVGLDQVGEKFEEGEYYLPDMMLAAEAMSGAIDYLEPHLREERAQSKEQAGRIVIGTVKGDLHSIGKDIVIMMMKAAGLEVFDLGVDVSSEKFIKAIEDNDADILGISALMTTTIGEQKKVIDLLTEKGLRSGVKVIVGGAPLSEEWAQKIGADAYAADAIAGVKKIKGMLSLPS